MENNAQAEYKELFNAIDSDNSGFINIKEMIEYLDSVCDDQIDEKEVRGIFATLDVTGDRTIDLWEFQSVMERMKNAGWRKVKRRRQRNGSICAKVADLRRIFDIVDKDKNGTLSFREARKGCKLLSERLGINEEGIEEWIKTTDFDGDKRITFEEFKFSVAGNTLIDMEL